MLALGLASFSYSTGFVEDSSGADVDKSKCTGAGTLPGDGPFCYHAKIGMLGVTEKLDIKLTRSTNLVTEHGVMDLVGSGISPFKCTGIKASKNGQTLSPAPSTGNSFSFTASTP